MGHFDRVYTDDQVEAAVHAYLDRKVGTQVEIVKRAAAGQLITRDGRKVRPFNMPVNTLRAYVKRERRRRHGAGSGSALENPDGVLEGMRKRMINVADAELAHWERQRAGKRDPDQLRQITRLMREIAALPAIGEGRSKRPGERVDTVQTEGVSRGGLAGSLLAAHRQSRPAPEHPTPKDRPAENEHTSATTVQTQAETENGHASGSSQREAMTGSGTRNEPISSVPWVARDRSHSQ